MGVVRTFRTTVGGLAAAGLAALAISGCGSSSIDPVAQAADVTAKVPGYKMAATMQVSVLSTPGASTQMTMDGVFDRANRSGSMTGVETIAGRRVQFNEVFSGLTFYIKAAGLPGISKVAGGKPWLKLDMTKMLGAMGLSSLPTSGTDPSQFVDYLRAVSSSTTKVGTDTIRGVVTTHYHATVDLSKYPNIVPAAQKAGATQAVKTLETTLGGHTLPMDAWIDKSNLVRRIGFGFTECAAGQHIKLAMTMDLFDYGAQPEPSIPSSADAYDLTPLVAGAMSTIKLGCSAA
jgi:hypothetical protein